MSHKHTEVTKRKISNKVSGKGNGMYGIKGQLHPFYGKHHTEESKQKNRESHLGKKASNETKRKLSESRIGKKHSKEWNDNIRKGNDGKHTYIGKDNPMYGKHHTKETKERISKNRINSGIAKLENNPNWCGGLSFLPYCEKFNEPLKNEIRKRDNYQCQNPDCLTSQLENLLLYRVSLSVHHIHYDKENCYPDLVALCNSCNAKVNFNRDYWEELFMKKLKERNLLNYFGDINAPRH